MEYISLLSASGILLKEITFGNKYLGQFPVGILVYHYPLLDLDSPLLALPSIQHPRTGRPLTLERFH